jgi:hypothetical protein
MLLRLRVELPDRPGSLGQVARTLGVAGADIVSVVVLERASGRAVDDFTVVWPASALVGRILVGLGAVPGVLVIGVWRCTELPPPVTRDVALVGQLAADPARGLGTLVDGVPGLVAADWAALTSIDPAWAGSSASAPLAVRYASWGAPRVPAIPDVAPLRPRAVTADDGTNYAFVPFQQAGLSLVVARGGPDGLARTGAADGAIAPPFHPSELERLAQLVHTTVIVLGTEIAESADVAA